MWMDRIRQQAPRIEAEALCGSQAAKDVITFYEMYRRSPKDPGAYVVAEEKFKAWEAQAGAEAGHG